MLRMGIVCFGVVELCLRILVVKALRVAVLCTILVCVWTWRQVLTVTALLAGWLGRVL